MRPMYPCGVLWQPSHREKQSSGPRPTSRKPLLAPPEPTIPGPWCECHWGHSGRASRPIWGSSDPGPGGGLGGLPVHTLPLTPSSFCVFGVGYGPHSPSKDLRGGKERLLWRTKRGWAHAWVPWAGGWMPLQRPGGLGGRRWAPAGALIPVLAQAVCFSVWSCVSMCTLCVVGHLPSAARVYSSRVMQGFAQKRLQWASSWGELEDRSWDSLGKDEGKARGASE